MHFAINQLAHLRKYFVSQMVRRENDTGKIEWLSAKVKVSCQTSAPAKKITTPGGGRNYSARVFLNISMHFGGKNNVFLSSRFRQPYCVFIHTDFK